MTQFALPPALNSEPRRVLVLGSTGTIGTHALAVIAAHPGQFRVVGLAADEARSELFPELLAQQAAAHPDARIAIPVGTQVPTEIPRSRLLTGPEAATNLVISTPADVVLNGMTGSAGLAPTLAALAMGTTLALANRQSLVDGGSLVTRAAVPGQIVPVGATHSALAQCLRAGEADEVASLVLTTSGGPFRGRTRVELEDVIPVDVLGDETRMVGPGPAVNAVAHAAANAATVNAATLADAGLELIEAHVLFGVPYRRIKTVVHPQSFVGSMVTFRDGATIAQASPPNMALAIAWGLASPRRLPDVAPSCDFTAATCWTFEPVDEDAFPALPLARAAGAAGGLVPAAYHAANEQAVAAFTAGSLPFLGIPQVLERIVDEGSAVSDEPGSIEDVIAAQRWARRRADEMIAEVTIAP